MDHIELGREQGVWNQMVSLRQILGMMKPDERSEKARRYAVTITELEKVMAYYHTFILDHPVQLVDQENDH